VRVSENPDLTSLDVLFVREHNSCRPCENCLR